MPCWEPTIINGSTLGHKDRTEEGYLVCAGHGCNKKLKRGSTAVRHIKGSNTHRTTEYYCRECYEKLWR